MEREPAMISLGAPSAPSVTGTPLNLSPAKTISPAALRINHASGEPIVTIHCDGHVDLNPKFTTEEAAMAFWRAVELVNPRRSRWRRWLRGPR